MVLDNANRVIGTPTNGYIRTQVAAFQRSALIYMREKTAGMPAVEAGKLLDVQAYYLSEFSERLIGDVFLGKNRAGEKRIGRLRHYVEATEHHPLFSDPDSVATRVFCRDKETPTPFSLDTDWHKAFQDVTRPGAQKQDKTENNEMK